MKALRWHARRDVRYEEVADAPRPGPGNVRIRVAWAGICGTDVEEYVAGPLYIPVDTPHPLTGAMAPLVLGHEFSGIVESVGEGVTTLRVGDHVAADALIYCGKCAACRRQSYNLCEKLAALGQMADGGLAELVTGPASTFVKIANSVPLDCAALSEPLAVAVRAVRRGEIEPGMSVIITGAGPIGLLALQVARVFGAKVVVVVEPREDRRKLAVELGASAGYPSANGLDNFDVAIECTGVGAAQNGALAAVRPRGRLVLVGIPTAPSAWNSWEIVNGEKEVIGSLSHLVREDFEVAVDLLANNRVNVAPLISRRVPLSEGPEVFRRLAQGETHWIKILMNPGHES
ncbi:MAG: 2,3-butanediol dehydrogenase [Firmicutes bacterium]|nr:2,3-butanediol dehydrogenase [Bacillota bacterium]